MTKTIRALILEDEPLAQQTLRALLMKEIPDLEVECRSHPNPEGDFDIYFIDNDFDGFDCAAKLAAEIRASGPDKLIMAFSGTLTAPILKELINEGCDGVCDKTAPDDLPMALMAAREYAEDLRRVLTDEVEETSAKGLLGAIRSISELLKEWNTRLDTQQQNLTPNE